MLQVALSRRTGTLAGLAAALLLTACAAPYQAPTGQTARLRMLSVQTKYNSNTHMVGYSSGTCTDPMALGMVGGVAKMFDKKPLGIPGAEKYAPDTFVEHKIPAGKRFMFTVRSLTNIGNCMATASFIPKVGKDYEVDVTWDPDTRMCRTRLFQIETGANGKADYSLEESTVREPNCSAGLN